MVPASEGGVLAGAFWFVSAGSFLVPLAPVGSVSIGKSG